MLDLTLLIEPGFVLGVADHRFFVGEVGVAAGELHELSVFNLDHLGDHFIEKIAVVGDDQHSPAVVGEVCLEPFDTAHVQVVGRLVEKQEIRLGKKQLAKPHAGFLASRECADMPVKIALVKTQTFQDADHVAFIGKTVLQLVLPAETVVRVHQRFQLGARGFVHAVLHAAQFFFHVQKILPGMQYLFIDRAVSLGIAVLRKISYTAVLSRRHGP